MRPLSARVKRGLPLAIVATAALAVPGSAGAALQAGAPAYSPLSGPVPVSGSIDQALSQGKVCYDRQIKTNTANPSDALALNPANFGAVQPDGTSNLFNLLGSTLTTLNGIEPSGSLLGAPNSVRISANAADGGKCVVMAFDPADYIGGTTLLSAAAHAVEDFSNEPSLPGSVSVSGGDFSPSSVPVLGGQAVGNLFTGVKNVDPNSNSITLNSNQPIDATGALACASNYEIWFPGGRHINATGITIGGKTVTVTFPSSNSDGPINVQQAIAVTAWEDAINTKSIVGNILPQNFLLSLLHIADSLTGSPLATFPLNESASLAAASSVRAMASKVDRVGPKSWVFTYDQSDLTLRDAGNPDSYALAVDGTKFWATSAQKLNDQQVQVNYAGITNPAEIVQVVDDGGLVGNQENLYGDAASIPTNFVVAANHNLGSGFTVGPDLTGAVQQPTTLANPDSSSVEALFDSAIDPTTVNPDHIMLIERDGSLKQPIGLIDAYNTNDNVGHVVLQFRKSYVDQSVGLLVENNPSICILNGLLGPLDVGNAVTDLFGNANSLGSTGFIAKSSPSTPSSPSTSTPSAAPSVSAPSLLPASVQSVASNKVIVKKTKKAVKKHKKHVKKLAKHKKRRRAAVTGRRR